MKGKPMGKRSFIFGMAAAFGLLVLAVASAMETKVANLVISNTHIRATIPTAKVAAGYLSITNNGSTVERLLGGSVDFAGKVSVHEMKMNNGVMKMRPIEGGLIIPAGETVVLKPGAEHLMFMKLKEPMAEGEKRSVTLTFESAGTVEVMFPVGDLAGGHADHSNHGEGNSHTDHNN